MHKILLSPKFVWFLSGMALFINLAAAISSALNGKIILLAINCAAGALSTTTLIRFYRLRKDMIAKYGKDFW